MEEVLVKVLAVLFEDRVFPDVAEIDTQVPFCVYRQIGGTPVNTLDGVPADRKNAIFEIVVVTKTRLETTTLIRHVEEVLVQAPLYATTLSGAQAMYDEETGLRAATQEFSVWDVESQAVGEGVVVVIDTAAALTPDPVETFNRTLEE